MAKLTAQMIHEAYCIATPDAWNKPWSEIEHSAETRYEVMAAYLNGQLAPEESARHFCAMLDCDQAVDEDGARCSACQAYEDLQRANDGFHDALEPCDHAQPPVEPDQRSSYATLYSDDPTYGQFHL